MSVAHPQGSVTGYYIHHKMQGIFDQCVGYVNWSYTSPPTMTLLDIIKKVDSNVSPAQSYRLNNIRTKVDESIARRSHKTGIKRARMEVVYFWIVRILEVDVYGPREAAIIAHIAHMITNDGYKFSHPAKEEIYQSFQSSIDDAVGYRNGIYAEPVQTNPKLLLEDMLGQWQANLPDFASAIRDMASASMARRTQASRLATDQRICTIATFTDKEYRMFHIMDALGLEDFGTREMAIIEEMEKICTQCAPA